MRPEMGIAGPLTTEIVIQLVQGNPPIGPMIEHVFSREAQTPYVQRVHVAGDSLDPVGSVWPCLILPDPIRPCRTCPKGRIH